MGKALVRGCQARENVGLDWEDVYMGERCRAYIF